MRGTCSDACPTPAPPLPHDPCPTPAHPGSAPFYAMLMTLAGHATGAVVGAFTPVPPQYGMLVLPALAANLDIQELDVLDHLRGDIAPIIV